MASKTFRLQYSDGEIVFDDPAKEFPNGLIGLQIGDTSDWTLTKQGIKVHLPAGFPSYTAAINFLKAIQIKKAAPEKASEPVPPKSRIKNF